LEQKAYLTIKALAASAVKSFDVMIGMTGTPATPSSLATARTIATLVKFPSKKTFPQKGPKTSV
jgi:hypothetical protein